MKTSHPVFQLSSKDCFFICTIVETQPQTLDYRLHIQIKSKQSECQGFAWVEGANLKSFIQDLSKITSSTDPKRKAILEGMSPNTLHIEIASVSSLGHMAISGFVGFLAYFDHSSFHHELKFGFEFDFSQLQNLVNFEFIKILDSQI